MTGSTRESQQYLLYILESLYRPLYQGGISENATQIGILANVGGAVNLGHHLCLSCKRNKIYMKIRAIVRYKVESRVMSYFISR